MVKRARLEILKDILEIAKNNHNIKPTPLLRKTNISSSRFKEYYTELIEKNFIKEMSNSNGKFVLITEKGEKFLEKYKTIVSFIEEFEI